jgi:lipopolysaccharide export system protein LptA
MSLPIYRLRRILAATAMLLALVVGSMYFYARSRATNMLKNIPGKIGFDIKQTANGFQLSKSDGKRTLFTVQASDVKEFKVNGNAELHNVSIVLYGRDSSRFDQIYGDDFAYNQRTGDVTAKGDVQIDLVSNSAGLVSPDQSTPKELKNPIHLKTRDLVFNKESGNATTDARVELRTPQASGWAVGVKYAGKSNTLTLSSQIHVELSGPNAAVLEAEHGVVTNDPRTIVLDHPHLNRQSGTMNADQATIYLDSQNQVERVLATGNVTTQSRASGAKRHSRKTEDASSEPQKMQGRADQAEFLFADDRNLLDHATLTGRVHLEQSGAQPILADAGRVIVDLAGQNQIRKIHAVDGVHLIQKATSETKTAETKLPETKLAETKPAEKGTASAPQDFDMTAPAIDFTVADGHILRHAETYGAPQITIAQQAQGPVPRPSSAGDRTVVTAGKFYADFAASEGRDRLVSLHGAPSAHIVNSSAGQPDRVSTSDAVDAIFLPQGGLEAVTQKGNVVYVDGQDPAKRVQAWGDAAHYTPNDQMLVLTGSPRVVNGGMQTTANSIRINRATGDAFAEGDVKSTYSQLKDLPNGALLASSSPIHVTALSMTAHSKAGTALYTGNARLWQDANIIEAPSLQFDRDRRFVTAQGTAAQPVQTILVEAEKSGSEKTPAKTQKKSSALGQSSPITITGQRLSYADAERRVHYEGGVVAKGADFTAHADTVDAFLLPHSQTSKPQSFAGPGQLDRMVADGGVVIQQPKRRAEGRNLVYMAAEDKFVLTGGPPSIFDAEQGKITGVSLTFFRRDDRVLVEGEASTPVVTTTRVAR